MKQLFCKLFSGSGPVYLGAPALVKILFAPVMLPVLILTARPGIWPDFIRRW